MSAYTETHGGATLTLTLTLTLSEDNMSWRTARRTVVVPEYDAATDTEAYRSAGVDYELAGPSEYTQKELVDFVFDTIKVNGKSMPMPQQILELQATGVGLLPNPMVNPDQIKLWAEDHTVDGSLPGFKELGITPQSLEDFGKKFLLRFKPGGHFVEEAGYH